VKPIAFNQPGLVDPALREALDNAWRRVMDSGWFIRGPEVESFEREFAHYCRAERCVGVSNGLDGLRLLLEASGIGPGDEVLTPANTFIASWLAISHTGAIPVPVEPDPDTFNIDPEKAALAITPKTRAILAVHLYGRIADMEALARICDERGLQLFEDACQAHGALRGGKPAGSWSRGAVFSFYPAKNLGALGDGGAVVTNDPGLAQRIRKLANYGSDRKYQHDLIGYNARLDELQAAFLREKLKFLDHDNRHRRRLASAYAEALSGIESLILPETSEDNSSVWHQFVIRSERRDEIAEGLGRKGVQTMIHYPEPPHRSAAYREMFQNQSFPISEMLADQILSLPMGNHINLEDVARIATEIKRILS